MTNFSTFDKEKNLLQENERELRKPIDIIELQVKFSISWYTIKKPKH